MPDTLSADRLLPRLEILFARSGFEVAGLRKAAAFLATPDDPAGFAQWSTLFARLYRYHDFCALELADALAADPKSAVHLCAEAKRHEALSGAYRLAGMAVDDADPAGRTKAPPPAALADEFAAVAGSLLTLFWAFAGPAERRAMLDERFAPDAVDDGTRLTLLAATPAAVLEPMGEIACALEDLAAQNPEAAALVRPVYPPLHPAADYRSAATDSQVEALSRLAKGLI